MKPSYFKIRRWFGWTPHRYEIGRPLAQNRRYADNFFLLKLHELGTEEYTGFYDFHLQHYLRINPEGEEEFYEHVWHIVHSRIKHFERKNPFSSSHETDLENVRKLRAFRKWLDGRDKWNARPYPALLTEKDKRILELEKEVAELKQDIADFREYEVQQKIGIRESYLPTLVHLIRQMPELKLPNDTHLLTCQNKSPYYKLISKYFTHGGKPIPLDTARNYFVEKTKDIPIKGTMIPEESRLFRIVPAG